MRREDSMIQYARSPEAPPMISFAQNCEDVLIDRVFRKSTGFFIDVGACHPVGDSVTKHLSLLGWRGINIEPDPDMCQAHAADRPGDINLQCAVGAVAGTVVLHQLPNRFLSTTNAAQLKCMTDDVRARSSSILVQMRTLANIVDEFVQGEVDLLKIDAEGSEAHVIAGADWTAFRPRLLVIEATKPWSSEPSWQEWEPVILGRNYIFAFFDGINRYYLRVEDRDLAEQLSVPVNALDCYVTYREHWLQARVRVLENELKAFGTEQLPRHVEP